MPKLLFVIGMQKSGTSLLNRMLMQQSVIKNPFLPEGKYFWGDNPPFTPIDEPCGRIYQSHKGVHGHYLSENDFSKDDQTLLIERIQKADVKEPILMNKNPNNSVRLRWLKNVFPDCKIVSMVRNPIANVYSLMKKHHHSQLNLNNGEEGWWGIKPKYWEDIICENKTLQCSRQWDSVNKQILADFEYVDLIINYDSLCSSPNEIINGIIKLCGIDHNVDNLPHCKNFNEEYKVGSRIVSKNQELRKSHNFNLSGLSEIIEFPAFDEAQINTVREICGKTWSKFLN
ncbi:MAG: sulfotransferase [Marinicellaceae bacterium]